MSAWLVWTHLGLFPIAGTDRFVLGAPAFANASVILPVDDAATLLASAVAGLLSKSDPWSPSAAVTSDSRIVARAAVKDYSRCLAGLRGASKLAGLEVL